MRKIAVIRYVIPVVLMFFATLEMMAQDEDYYDEFLQRIDTVENPVYKPVISLSYGMLSFIGDVQNNLRSPIIGNPAGRFAVSTFIDNQHYITANFYFMMGLLSGEGQSFTDLSKILNFRSDIYSFGITASYGFGHFIPEDVFLRPFVSLGIEQMNFNSKGDIFQGPREDGLEYFYWSDGTVRSLAEGEIGAAYPLERDYIYETDLRSYEEEKYHLGDYNSSTVVIPVEIGLRLRLSQRIFMSLATEYHYTFSDVIDNVAAEGTYNSGNKMKDSYLFTHASLHFDMFSDPKIRTVDLLYADVELDPIFYDDEDGDFILDLADLCPGTPYGVVTDTLGCPLDGDSDGVPDYLDKEAGTPEGSWVDEEGVHISEDDFISSLKREEALVREDLDVYLQLMESKFTDRSIEEIPEKFASFDSDADGYISFDELLKVIDEYFDFNIELSLEELRQVNEFFFSQ